MTKQEQRLLDITEGPRTLAGLNLDDVSAIRWALREIDRLRDLLKAPQEPPHAILEPHDNVCWRCGGAGLLKPYTLQEPCRECRGSGRARL